jgi:hypothetical protein
MDEDEGAYENEPVEKDCESCESTTDIENMIDCPKYEEDLEEKGIVPGWICKGCCEEEFINDPGGCTEHCGNEILMENIKAHFEKCVDLKGLTKTETGNGTPVFADELNRFYITAEADKLLEPSRPLNVVIDTFSDNEGTEEGIICIKDNHKNIIPYSLDLFQEIEKRFSSINLNYEMFCVLKGPLCMVYQIRDLSFGAMLAPRLGNDEEIDFQKIGIDVATRIKTRYSEAEDFFGVEVVPSREKLKAQIQALSEDELIKEVLVPVLNAQDFKNVKPISFHGPGESGGDFHPFYKINEFGKITYYSAQAKAVKIHSKAGAKEGNVNQLIDQMKKLFRTPFKSFIDNTEKRITYAFIFCSQDVVNEARDQLFHEIENDMQISLVEIDDIVSAALEKGVADQILNYCNRRNE